MPSFESLPRPLLRLLRLPPQAAYALGLGPVLGKLVLLLITTGRKSGQPRVTPLQYEQKDGLFYLGSARGQAADWFRNILVNPQVQIRVKGSWFTCRAQPVTDPEQIADFLELRLKRHPKMVGAMLKSEGLAKNPTRAQLEGFASHLALVILEPIQDITK
jgi:deazaflavin-dependent oxidoreductase (nitroreductase family)